MFKLPNITTQVAEVAPEDILDSIDRALINSATSPTGILSSSGLGLTMDLEMTVSAGRGGVLAGQRQKAGQRPLPTTFEEVYANIDRVKGGVSGSNNQIYSGTELQAIAKSLGLKVVPGKKAQAKVITDAVARRYGRTD